jgi:signal transduction histidine kinase
VLYTGWIVLVLVHSLFRWGSGRDIALGAVLVVVEYAVAVVTDSGGPGDALGGAAVLLSAAALGVAARYRAVAREQLVEQAKLQERELLARELHDTVAHHVSAIATQAQAGLVLARSVPAGGATEALEVIDREAARALAEMRTMVGALRDARGSAPPVPRHRLADIEALAASGADSLPVDVELCGDLAGLAPSLESALYRVAQESVTNARRHAQDATRVAITVTGNAADVQLRISDDGGRTATSALPGYGLVGMSERVALLGGTLTAGSGSGGGWSVHVVLPRQRSAT